MITRIEAIAASVAVAAVQSYLARNADGIVTDEYQFGAVTRRYFIAAVKFHQLDDAERQAVFDRLGWAFERIKHEADKIAHEANKIS